MKILKTYFPEIQKCVEDYNISLESLQENSEHNFLYTHAITEYKKHFLNLLYSISEEEIEKNTRTLVNFTIEHEISYLFLYSELITVVRSLLGILIKKHELEHINEIDQFFAAHEYRITNLYLKIFLRRLAFKNDLRLSHIEMMPEKKFMVHYESHIKWMLRLIEYIQSNTFDDNYPELNSNMCEFGKWMHSATTTYLISTSHYKLIEELHINLHDLAANIVSHCKSGKIRPSTIIHLLQKIEHYSLEIGNEIAFLNEIEESAKDPLTHLLTRRLFNKIMLNKLEIAKATGREFALMMCDLDHFKVINDTYGHAIGDIVLKDFSNLMERTLRKSDYIFRFGGEEFIILFPATDKEEALFLAQKVCDATAAQEVKVESVTIKYTVSIGTLAIMIDNSTVISQDLIDSYISHVDEKLYLAKEKGRNRVE